MINPLSLHGLRSWLTRQDPSQDYSYTNSHKCLITQYLRASGFPVTYCTAEEWRDGTGKSYRLPPYLNAVATGLCISRQSVTNNCPIEGTFSTHGISNERTFGAALARVDFLISQGKA